MTIELKFRVVCPVRVCELDDGCNTLVLASECNTCKQFSKRTDTSVYCKYLDPEDVVE